MRVDDLSAVQRPHASALFCSVSKRKTYIDVEISRDGKRKFDRARECDSAGGGGFGQTSANALVAQNTVHVVQQFTLEKSPVRPSVIVFLSLLDLYPSLRSTVS